MTTTNTLTGHRRILAEFIKLYRNEPCLWMTKYPEYRDRVSKDNAYERLIAKLRELDSTADRDKVVKKINSLRTNWRKEKKKVEETAGTADPYKPRLWYYDLFEFLEEYSSTDTVKYCDYEPASKIEKDELLDTLDYEELQSDDPTEHDFLEEYDQEPINVVPKMKEIKQYPASVPSPPASTTKMAFPTPVVEKVEKSVRLHSTDEEDQQSSYGGYSIQRKRFKPEQDPHEAFGRNVAMKLRHITDKTQRLLAEKLINDALFMAELGELSMAHGVTSFNTTVRHSPFETEYISGPMEQYDSISQHQAHQEVEVVSKVTSSDRRMRDLQEMPRSVLRRV